MRSGAGAQDSIRGRTSFGLAIASRALLQEYVHCAFTRDGSHTLVTQRRQIDVTQQILSGSEQYRTNREMQFVDETRLEVLPEGGDAATETDIATSRSELRLLRRHGFLP